jgi:hypothetical protein
MDKSLISLVPIEDSKLAGSCFSIEEEAVDLRYGIKKRQGKSTDMLGASTVSVAPCGIVWVIEYRVTEETEARRDVVTPTTSNLNS